MTTKRPPKAAEEEEDLGRGKRKRTQRVPFSPTTRGQCHKAVGFVETREENRNFPHKTEDSVLTNSEEEFNSEHAGRPVGTDTHTTEER